MGLEKNRVENPIKTFLTTRRIAGDKVFFFKLFESAEMISGLPDVICSINGVFVGIEMKSPTLGTLRLDQKTIGQQIIDSNGLYIVCDDLDEFINFYTKNYKSIEQMRGSFYDLTLNKDQSLELGIYGR